jgi:NAD(P)-dependent dehydrogenase (short-subunit alcohol dehydrogenase family)
VAYGASKHAAAGMTKDAAIEYGQYDVSINAVAPGAIMTNMVKGSLIQIANPAERVEVGESLRGHHDAAKCLAALDVRVRGGGGGERERLVDHDPQLAGPDACDQLGDHRVDAWVLVK